MDTTATVTYEQVQTFIKILQSQHVQNIDINEKFILTSIGKNGGLYTVTIQYNEFDQDWHINAIKIER